MMDARQTELQEMLEERRRALQDQMLRKIRVLREAARVDPTGPVTDFSDDPAHEDIDFALAQMQTETMNKIHAALERIASSEYGVCEGCHREIPMLRLRAVPFAVLCRTCQEGPKRLDCVPAEVVRRASPDCDDRRLDRIPGVDSKLTCGRDVRVATDPIDGFWARPPEA